MKVTIGISAAKRQANAAHPARFPADSCTLNPKTHNPQRNVTGPTFNTLRAIFGQQYTEPAAAVDAIAEEMLRQLVVGQETVLRSAGGGVSGG